MKNNKNSKHKNNQTQTNQESTSPDVDVTRRDLLKGAGAFSALLVSSSASQVSAQEPDTENSNPRREALEVLTAEEAMVLEAICDRLIPSDSTGPGALEARAAHYIDRSLASHNSEDRDHYMLSLTAINRHSLSKFQNEFYTLSVTEQDSVISELQGGDISGCSPGSSAFFSMVRSHTIDGTFCDPYYGGNRDFVGWDMLRYPGVRLGVSDEDVRMGSALEPSHQSAYDHSSYTHQPEIQRGKGDD